MSLHALNSTHNPKQHDYGPFGEPIRMTGTMAKNDPFRFSTKYDDDESDLLYYGYRYYKPSTGTWPNRDPLNERGFELIASKPETSKTTFSDRILIALAFFQQKNPVLFESLKTWLREDPRALQETSQQNANLYAFTADAPISFQDLLGLDSPSSGFTCDKDLLTAAKILCYCPYARSAVVAGICNGCWNGCNKYCLEQYLDGTTDENQMKKCVLDCDKRELKCIRSGCGLKFN
jgi:RHS repeat-associated protein